jgi:L-rhamnose isomerase
MWEGANASTVSEEHATSMLLMLTLGTMVPRAHIHTMLTPKTRENNKIHITTKVAQFRKIGTAHFQIKTKRTSMIAVGYDSK